MFTDPLAVTYDGSAKSLPRVGVGPNGSVYRTADSEFEITISNGFPKARKRGGARFVVMNRYLPDPTPSNVFDDYREIRNGFGYFYTFDPDTRAEVSVDIPRLRTALDSWMTPTFQSRVISGEQ
jgi:hypothetical protein